MSSSDCLYIGPYRQLNDLDGRNSASILRHLSAYRDICSRPIFYLDFLKNNFGVSRDISISNENINLENKNSLIQYDVIGKKCQIVKTEFNKHIGILRIEDDAKISKSIVRSINRLDLVVVFSDRDKKRLKGEGVKSKIIAMFGHHCIDPEQSNMIDKKIILKRENVNKNILFTIIPNIYDFRYNFIDLLVCYYNSFKKTDNKMLLIATYNNSKEVKENISKIKMSTTSPNTLPDVGIVNLKDYMSCLDICGRYIDASCDFNSKPEHTICIMNKIPIISPDLTISHYSYSTKKTPKLLHAKSPYRYSTDSFWTSPDSESLIDVMKSVGSMTQEDIDEENQFLTYIQNHTIEQQISVIKEIVNVCS